MIGDRTSEVVFFGAEIRYSSPYAATMLNDGGVIVAYTSENLYGEIVYNRPGDDYFHGRQTLYGYSLDDPGGGGGVTPIEDYFVFGEAARSAEADSSPTGYDSSAPSSTPTSTAEAGAFLTGYYSLGVFLPSVTALPTGVAIAAFNRPFGTDRIEGFYSDLGGPSLLASGDVRWATVFGTGYGFFTILIDDTGEREGTLVLQSRALNGIPIGDAREMAELGSGASVLPGAAVLRYGDVALAWIAEADDGSDVLQVQRVDGGGWTIGDVLSFGPVAPAPGERAVLVEALPDGTFVTLLHEGDALILRHHAADGTLLASPHALVTVADSVAPDGPAGSVPYAMRHVKEGLLAIVWAEPDATGSTDTDLWFGYFTADGTAIGEPMRLNAEQAGLQSAPVLTRAVGDRLFYAYGQAADDALGVPDKFAGAFLTVPDTVQLGSDVSDNLTGGPLNDLMTGAGAKDLLKGEDGDDWLFGQGADDTLRGGLGSDRLWGGDGGDILDGGDGRDTAQYGTSTSGVGVDLLGNFGHGGEAEGDRYLSVEAVAGSSYGDSLSMDDANNEVDGGDGDDVILGAGGDDRLRGGNGNDYLLGGDGDELAGDAGADRLEGGAGFDTADYSESAGGVTIDLFLNAGLGSDAEGDRFDGIEAVIGSAFADRVTLGQNSGHANLGDGDDVAFGSYGDDSLFGDEGSDRLDGGPGDDDLSGGGGGDVFVFDRLFGNDTILDFDANPAGGQDRLDVSGFGWTSFAAMGAAGTTITQSGGGALIEFRQQVDLLTPPTPLREISSEAMGVDVVIVVPALVVATIRLQGVVAADLSQDDFLFA